MVYLTAKAGHIVGVICWMGSLLYLVRLSVYQAEVSRFPPEQRKILHPQLALMQRRLLRIISTPAMVVTAVTGAIMVLTMESIPGWFWVKAVLLVGVFAYHHWAARVVSDQATGELHTDGERLRILNEVGTLLMIAVVGTAVLKSRVRPEVGAAALIAIGASLWLGYLAYRRHRRAKTCGHESCIYSGRPHSAENPCNPNTNKTQAKAQPLPERPPEPPWPGPSPS